MIFGGGKMTQLMMRPIWSTRFPSLMGEIDNLFDNFFGQKEFQDLQKQWVPALDVHESKKDVVVSMDAPSIDPKEVEITITDNRLVVRGEKKAEEEIKEQNCHRSERFYGVFQRTIQLPTEVVGDKAKATYKDGVLRITIPKSEKVVPKEIKVEIR